MSESTVLNQAQEVLLKGVDLGNNQVGYFEDVSYSRPQSLSPEQIKQALENLKLVVDGEDHTDSARLLTENNITRHLQENFATILQEKTEMVFDEKFKSTAEEAATDIATDIAADVATEVATEMLGSGIGSGVSQGRNAKYNFTTPGWKRVLNIIRVSGGQVNFGIARAKKSVAFQALGIQFAGNVISNQEKITKTPVLYQIYNHEMCHNNEPDNSDKANYYARITKVRLAYPKRNANYTKEEGDTLNYQINPINCYLDIYVDFDPNIEGSGPAAFNINYAGYAESHNCVPIITEQDATNTGIYNEELQFFELEVDKNQTLYMPRDSICAGAVYDLGAKNTSVIKTGHSSFRYDFKEPTDCYFVVTENHIGDSYNRVIADYYENALFLFDTQEAGEYNSWHIELQDFIMSNGSVASKRPGFELKLPRGTYVINTTKIDTESVGRNLRYAINKIVEEEGRLQKTYKSSASITLAASPHEGKTTTIKITEDNLVLFVYFNVTEDERDKTGNLLIDPWSFFQMYHIVLSEEEDPVEHREIVINREYYGVQHAKVNLCRGTIVPRHPETIGFDIYYPYLPPEMITNLSLEQKIYDLYQKINSYHPPALPFSLQQEGTEDY